MKCPVPVPQVIHEIFDCIALTDGVPNQFGRVLQVTMLVDIFAKPREDGSELSLCNRWVHLPPEQSTKLAPSRDIERISDDCVTK